MLRYIIPAVLCLLAISEDGHAAVLKQFEGVPFDVTKNISFLLFTRLNKDTPWNLEFNNDGVYTNSPYDTTKPTVIFIHGFGESGYGTSGHTIKDAYLDSGEYNIICVDWESLATKPWYNDAIRHSALVGKHTAAMVKWLEQKGALSIPALHIIGFGLGAHVSAFVGEELAKHQTEQIGRITGLNPVGSIFNKFSIQSNGIGKEDAKFVDVIYTSSQLRHLHSPIGHADFHVNYGQPQPGCKFSAIECSNSRAWQYYAESVKNPCGFPAETCTQWKPIVSGCSQQKHILMGVAANKQDEGVFLVTTNSEAPFATSTTNLENIVHITINEVGEDHALHTLTHETEIGLSKFNEYCVMNSTQFGVDPSVEYNIISVDGENPVKNEYCIDNIGKE